MKVVVWPDQINCYLFIKVVLLYSQMLTCKFIFDSMYSILISQCLSRDRREQLRRFEDKSSKGAVFCKFSWLPHQSEPVSDMFDIIQEHISWHDICLGTNLRLNSRKNKYANHSYCQNLMSFFMIYAFQVGLFYISVFLPFTCICMPCV